MAQMTGKCNSCKARGVEIYHHNGGYYYGPHSNPIIGIGRCPKSDREVSPALAMAIREAMTPRKIYSLARGGRMVARPA